MTDASSSHISAVLQQWRPGCHWRPLAFFSAKLSSAQQSYSAFDRELLAVNDSIYHFRHLLEGRSFTVFTDHKPLIGALTRATEPRSSRQQRQLSYIGEFNAVLRHIAGQANVVADALSRPSPVAQPPPPAAAPSTSVSSTSAAAAVQGEFPSSPGAHCPVAKPPAAPSSTPEARIRGHADISMGL